MTTDKESRQVSGGGADEVKPSSCVGEHGSVMIPPECNHEWVEEYYGTRCYKCNQFHAFGCEPWAPDEEPL